MRRDAREKSRGAEISTRTFDMVHLFCKAAWFVRRNGLLALDRDEGFFVIPEGMPFTEELRAAHKNVGDERRFRDFLKRRKSAA